MGMKKALIVIDMQNDFVTGSLGSKEAESILPAVVEEIRRCREAGYELLATLDTHEADYLSTQEGKKLPVPHCVRGTEGHALCDEVAKALGGDCQTFEKVTFGSRKLAEYLALEQVEQVELIGLCTDICVISNALLIKAFLPEARIVVDARCCAGVTPASHQNALEAMRVCQIEVVGA